MISCTEFIPLYSELFRFLEILGGEKEVMDYWYYISENGVSNTENPNSLISFLARNKENPLEGAWKYWTKSLTEEACDLFRVYDEERGFIYSHMRHCPSRGMLNSLQHVEPYHNYCEHCNVIYYPALKQYGLDRIRDNSRVENAECYSLIFQKGQDPKIDFSAVKDEDFLGDGVKVMDIKASDNKYLHRDFHFHCDLALRYLSEKKGMDCANSFLAEYAARYYRPIIEKIKEEGLLALAKWIQKTYEVEEAEEVVSLSVEDGVLTLSVSFCPAISYLRSVNCEPCPCYLKHSSVVYEKIAEEAGLRFQEDEWDENGKCVCRFYKK